MEAEKEQRTGNVRVAYLYDIGQIVDPSRTRAELVQGGGLQTYIKSQ